MKEKKQNYGYRKKEKKENQRNRKKRNIKKNTKN